MENSVLNHPKVRGWIEETRTQNTRRTYSMMITKFFNWYGKPVDSFLLLPPDEKRHTALQYQFQNARENPNTINAVLTSLNSFLDTYDMKIKALKMFDSQKLSLFSLMWSVHLRAWMSGWPR